MKLWAVFVAIITLTVVVTQAELVFEEEHLKLFPKADQEIISATYHFTYTGEKPIVVHEVDANCGCLNAESDKDRYVKGDKGTISLDFELGHREGTHKGRVWMEYTEEIPAAKAGVPVKPPTPKENLGPSGEDPATFVTPKLKHLTAEIEIPVVVNIEPKMTTWLVDSKPEPKEIKITMKHLAPVKIKEVNSSRDNVKVEVKEVKPGESYVITLTPEATDKKQLGMLTILTDCPVERHTKKLGFFSIASEDPNAPKDSQGRPILPPPTEALRNPKS